MSSSSRKFNGPGNCINCHQDCSIVQWVRAEILVSEGLQDVGPMNLISCDTFRNFPNLSELFVSSIKWGQENHFIGLL